MVKAKYYYLAFFSLFIFQFFLPQTVSANIGPAPVFITFAITLLFLIALGMLTINATIEVFAIWLLKFKSNPILNKKLFIRNVFIVNFLTYIVFFFVSLFALSSADYITQQNPILRAMLVWGIYILLEIIVIVVEFMLYNSNRKYLSLKGVFTNPVTKADIIYFTVVANLVTAIIGVPLAISQQTF